MNRFDNKLFVIDKPCGPTSFDVVTAFRKATGLRKVGHSGTLDPLAEGVLLVCTGRATRAVEHFMNLEKEYEFEVGLGVETTTLDAEGEVVRSVPCPDFPHERIADAAASFVGDYDLTPPAFSALKVDGRRMYEMARAGETPQIASRKVKIYAFDVIHVDLPLVRGRLRCSRGTYVRSLARDFGEKLGVPAYVKELTRTRIGPYMRADAFPMQRLLERDIDELEGMPLESALEFLPGIILTEASKKALMYGVLPAEQDVSRTIGAIKSNDPFRILDGEGTLLAIGRRDEGENRSRVHCVDSYRLFVEPGGTGAAQRRARGR